MNSLRIRPMRPDEISIAVNGATAEGWNPGLADDACFTAADPEGFFIGELNCALAATVSCVNYGASFALLHFYTVQRLAPARVRTAHMECGHRARRPTRDRARWRAGAAAKLHEVRFELAYANVRQWVSLIVADLSTGKWAVPGAYSENGDNCQMQLRRRVRTH
jgi:hypothetical protein